MDDNESDSDISSNSILEDEITNHPSENLCDSDTRVEDYNQRERENLLDNDQSDDQDDVFFPQ